MGEKEDGELLELMAPFARKAIKARIAELKRLDLSSYDEKWRETGRLRALLLRLNDRVPE
jgi:hypothetical protein